MDRFDMFVKILKESIRKYGDKPLTKTDLLKMLTLVNK